MAHSGKFRPKNIKKYKGEVSNIFYRSSWELKIMRFFDLNNKIDWWKSEEIVIPYVSPTDGKRHRYFPDFLYGTLSGSTYLVEVKPKKQTRPPKKKTVITEKYVREVFEWGKNEAKWKAAVDFCKQKNWIFQIWTEDQIKELGIKI